VKRSKLNNKSSLFGQRKHRVLGTKPVPTRRQPPKCPWYQTQQTRLIGLHYHPNQLHDLNQLHKLNQLRNLNQLRDLNQLHKPTLKLLVMSSLGILLSVPRHFLCLALCLTQSLFPRLSQSLFLHLFQFIDLSLNRKLFPRNQCFRKSMSMKS
jgi:hypothetical protein